jgi:hypothetical protein
MTINYRAFDNNFSRAFGNSLLGLAGSSYNIRTASYNNFYSLNVAANSYAFGLTATDLAANSIATFAGKGASYQLYGNALGKFGGYLSVGIDAVGLGYGLYYRDYNQATSSAVSIIGGVAGAALGSYFGPGGALTGYAAGSFGANVVYNSLASGGNDRYAYGVPALATNRLAPGGVSLGTAAYYGGDGLPHFTEAPPEERDRLHRVGPDGDKRHAGVARCVRHEPRRRARFRRCELLAVQADRQQSGRHADFEDAGGGGRRFDQSD